MLGSKTAQYVAMGAMVVGFLLYHGASAALEAYEEEEVKRPSRRKKKTAKKKPKAKVKAKPRAKAKSKATTRKKASGRRKAA